MVTKPAFHSLNEISEKAKLELPELYYKAWSAEHLCSSITEAEKVLHFDPNFSFVGIDEETDSPFSLLNTLPLSQSELHDFIREGITYRHIEDLSRNQHQPIHTDLVLCFSICGKADTRVMYENQEQSVARFMITQLRSIGVPVYVYTRKKSVDMHIHLGANPTPLAVINNSRPEDIAGEGVNIILQYA
jgi:hypothetical protein